jgi:hypothetical protein
MAALKAALEDKDPDLRRLAARALGKADVISPEALASLKAAMRDKDPDVRHAAREEYERAYRRVMDYPTQDHVPTLIAALKDSQPFVRRDAAGALAKVGAISALPDVMAALKAATKDKDPEVRRAATATWERIPLIEAYLLQGRSAEAEAALVQQLKVSPRDDQARFALGVLRFVHGVERLGQSLHKYGCQSEKTNIPFLRLPVPNNPDPDPIRYTDLRRLLDNFGRDLSAAEATLAGISDDNVKLPLHLAAIRLDLVGDGKSTAELIDILKKIMQRGQFDFQKSNPDLLVCFDRGDVAWLRAYCHLLMGMLDFYLAFDTEPWFDLAAGELFARPKNRFAGEDTVRGRKMVEAGKIEIALQEPARLGKFRKHLLKVAELNRETWKHIRAEKDDDHEWLPNPKQTGVLGLPVRNEMIDGWLAMVAELEALLNGERTLTFDGLGKDFVKDGKGLNLKALLEDPPAKFILQEGFPRTLPDKYFTERRDVKIDVLSRVFQLFGDPTAVAYAAWFN